MWAIIIYYIVNLYGSIIIIIIINLSHEDRGHTKGDPVLGAPPYKHTYAQNTKT